MRRLALRIASILGLLLASGLALSACKEGTELAGPTLLATPAFDEAPIGASDHYVAVRRGAVDGSRITLEIVVGEVDEPVSAIALKVKYPNAFARYVSCSDGSLFPTPGTCFASETGPGSGEVFLARSIVAPQPPVVVSGEKVILKVEFLVFGLGEGEIEFLAQNLGGGDASALLDAQGDPILMSWFVGTLAGR